MLQKNGYSIPCNTQSTKAGIQTQSLHHFHKICPIQAGMQKNAKRRRNTSPFKTTANTPQDRHGDVSGRKWVELEREMSVGSSYLAGCLVKSLNGYGDLLCFGWGWKAATGWWRFIVKWRVPGSNTRIIATSTTLRWLLLEKLLLIDEWSWGHVLLLVSPTRLAATGNWSTTSSSSSFLAG